MTIRNHTDNPNNIDVQTIQRTLLDAATAAGKITLPAFRSGLSVQNKEQQSFDPVTEADCAAELVIRQIIERDFPQHAIIGEEHDNKLTDSPYSWIIDPIDGTRSFISGVPLWGTLIGVAYQGIPFAGIMTQPFTGEIFLGLPGNSTHQVRDAPPQNIKTSAIKMLKDAILFTTTPVLFEGKMAHDFSNLESKIRLSRYGSDCYGYCLLAAGHADLVVETSLKIYDIAALIPIVRNAGGVITNFEGKQPGPCGNVIAAATPELHAMALEIMGHS